MSAQWRRLERSLASFSPHDPLLDPTEGTTVTEIKNMHVRESDRSLPLGYASFSRAHARFGAMLHHSALLTGLGNFFQSYRPQHSTLPASSHQFAGGFFAVLRMSRTPSDSL